MEAPWPPGSCPSYPYTRICFPNEPICNKFLHRQYHELPPSLNCPPSKPAPLLPHFHLQLISPQPHTGAFFKVYKVSINTGVSHQMELRLQRNHLQRIYSFKGHPIPSYLTLLSKIPQKDKCYFDRPHPPSIPRNKSNRSMSGVVSKQLPQLLPSLV